MRISESGIELIKRFEGFSACVYEDVAGLKTIGYGHCLTSEEDYSEISEDEAEGLLLEDIAEAEECINNLVDAPLTQNQFDALVSLVFNIGSRAFQNSTLLRSLNQENYEAVGKQWDRWVYAAGKRVRGLELRRMEEKTLFLQDVEIWPT